MLSAKETDKNAKTYAGQGLFNDRAERLNPKPEIANGD